MSVSFDGIYFDFFGTLIDSRYSITNVWSKIARRFGYELNHTDPRILQGMQNQHQIFENKRYDVAILTAEQKNELNIIVLNAMGINENISEATIDEEFKQEFSKGIHFRLYPNCKTTLEQIREFNLEIGLLSHASPSLCKPVLERFGLLDIFDLFILTEDTGYHKSQIEIYEIALKAMNTKNPKKILHVGDDINYDVRMAQKVGMTPIFFDPYNQHKLEDVITITDLSEVLHHLL